MLGVCPGRLHGFADRRLGAGKIARLGVGRRQHVQGENVLILRRLAQAASDLHGVRPKAGLGPRVADEFVHDFDGHRRVRRLQGHLLLAVLHGLLELALPPEGIGQSLVCQRIVRLEFQRRPKMLHRPVR